GTQLRNNGTPEGAGCRDDAVGLDHACGGFNTEARTTDPSFDLQDVDTATDGGRDLLGIGAEIVRHRFLGREIVWTDIPVDIRKCETRKAIVPCRAVRDQRVPSFRAPAFGDPMPLDHDMRPARLAQMLPHGQPRLASAHDKRVYLFN